MIGDATTPKLSAPEVADEAEAKGLLGDDDSQDRNDSEGLGLDVLAQLVVLTFDGDAVDIVAAFTSLLVPTS
jgi:hypothetical protein